MYNVLMERDQHREFGKSIKVTSFNSLQEYQFSKKKYIYFQKVKGTNVKPILIDYTVTLKSRQG